MDMREVTPQRYLSTANEANLDRHGDSHLGVGYTKSPAEAISIPEHLLNQAG